MIIITMMMIKAATIIRTISNMNKLTNNNNGFTIKELNINPT
jgi:hypothetical protein